MQLQSPQLELRKRSLSDVVVETVLDAILSGKFAPGQPLSTTTVADWLGVSRTPVREAFSELHRKRFLERDTNRSFKVARWRSQDLMEVAQVRAALEALNIELAITSVCPEDLDRLESIVVQMERALSREDYDRLVELDSQFHYALWQIPENGRLFQVLNDLRPQVRYFMYLTRPGDESEYPSTHRQLMSMLASGDIERAPREVCEHILSTAERLIDRLETQQPEERFSAG